MTTAFDNAGFAVAVRNTRPAPTPPPPARGWWRPGVTRRLIAEFARTSKRPRALKPLPELTAGEHDTLMLIARALSSLEIAEPDRERLDGQDARGRSAGRDRVQAIIYAYEHGVVEPGA